MFELLFKYPAAAFAKGQVVFLGHWPLWILGLTIAAAAALLAWPYWKRRKSNLPVKPVALWLLQTALVSLLLVVLWQPALSVATLRPRQNIVAVVVDDSSSMAVREEGATRAQRAVSALDSGVLSELEKRFQVRLYRVGRELERTNSLKTVKGEQTASRLGAGLRQLANEAASLPVGAILLLSDGADNSGGIDLQTITEVKRQRIPVHTVGFGRERPQRDVELLDVQVPARVLADSKISAQVSLRAYGLENQATKITLKTGSKVLASREIRLKGDGASHTETVVFGAGTAGAKSIEVEVTPIGSEESKSNNLLTRVLNVDGRKPRVLYIEGEPKWEYKFIRRAIELDQGLELVSMLRTTQNKIYRQGVSGPEELNQGFPATVDELFGYDGVIIGGVEASYFTSNQLELLKQFVDRRGGGILFLGGRSALSDGGWGASGLADLLPVTLPNRRDTFQRDPAKVELTAEGRDSLLCRIEDNPDSNAERWKKLPYLQNYQDTGSPKAGAVVLANMTAGNRKMPLLVTQNYGRGRAALFATSGSWRWQMLQSLEDKSHEIFWQQLLRWMVSGTMGRVISSTPKSVFSDETRVPLAAEVRDKNYLPVSDAQVQAKILRPDGGAEDAELRPDPANPGSYLFDWGAAAPGAYVAEITARRGDEELGRDVITFRREDGVAENFRTFQNRELLEKLSEQTGGRYYKPDELKKVSSEISYSEAGISSRETRDLWNMPIIFLVALMLRAGEWLLRRKWGVV